MERYLDVCLSLLGLVIGLPILLLVFVLGIFLTQAPQYSARKD